jgi:L-fucose mutarotase/ribose pyranase (RbsD/FucU family)
MSNHYHPCSRRFGWIFSLAICFVLPLMAQGEGSELLVSPQQSWQRVLADRLPLYGHRNWIVIADSAYPAQSRDGIETISTGADQLEVLRAVLTALDGTKHVKPIVYTDAELKFVPEQDAPGINVYRDGLAKVLGDRSVSVLPHEQVIAKLDEAGKTFRVLILKTKLTVPYTSVFLQLDCAYWNAEKEQRLRTAMESAK